MAEIIILCKIEKNYFTYKYIILRINIMIRANPKR